MLYDTAVGRDPSKIKPVECILIDMLHMRSAVLLLWVTWVNFPVSPFLDFLNNMLETPKINHVFKWLVKLKLGI